MLSLLILVIFGLGMAFFATQNIATATIVFAGQIYKGVPMYVIVIGSLLLGIFVSWLISIVNALSSAFTIHGKDTALAKVQESNRDLKRRLRDLEIENARLAGSRSVKIHKEVKTVNRKPSVLDRIRLSI